MSKTNKNKKADKVQYKVWVHIEQWVNGEPIEDGQNYDENPISVHIPDSKDNLVDTLEEALAIQEVITGDRPATMRLFVLIMHGDIEPELKGPFCDMAEQGRFARAYREENGDNDGLYSVTTYGDGEPDIQAYYGGFFEQE